MDVDLAPGASETYEFHIEAETLESNESFDIRLLPSVDALNADGVAVEQTWTRDGEAGDGWPESVELGPNELVVGVLTLKLTNDSPTKIVALELTVRIETSDKSESAPTEEQLRLEIRLR